MRKPRSIFSLAGWLFADLMLALMVIALGTAGTGDELSLTPSPGARPEAAAPSPTSVVPATVTSPVAPARPLGLDPVRVERGILVPEDALLRQDPAAVRTVRGQVEAAFSTDELRDRNAGLVLTFGRAPVSDPDRGVRLSSAVNAILAGLPLFEGAVQESFLTFNPPPNTNVEIWVYLLAVTH